MANPVAPACCYFCGATIVVGDYGANVTVVSLKKFKRKHYHLCETCFAEEIVPFMESRVRESDESPPVPVLQAAGHPG